tara:strand:- start:1667 stop:1849 length:183 start_codon:yes stop_codon:yes gene_type:complete
VSVIIEIIGNIVKIEKASKNTTKIEINIITKKINLAFASLLFRKEKRVNDFIFILSFNFY